MHILPPAAHEYWNSGENVRNSSKTVVVADSKHPLTDKQIVLRAPESGVFIGVLVSKTTEHGTMLKGAQRIWSWEGALDTATLAAAGPQAAQVSPVVPGLSCIPDGRECFEMSPSAKKKFKSVGIWSK